MCAILMPVYRAWCYIFAAHLLDHVMINLFLYRGPGIATVVARELTIDATQCRHVGDIA